MRLLTDAVFTIGVQSKTLSAAALCSQCRAVTVVCALELLEAPVTASCQSKTDQRSAQHLIDKLSGKFVTIENTIFVVFPFGLN